MKPVEIRELTNDAILAKLNDAKEELMNLRFQQAMGSLTDPTRLPQTRREIARLYTILRERQQAAPAEGEK